MTSLQYPIGEFDITAEPTSAECGQAFDDIEAAPARLRAAVAGLTEEQLDTPYRPGGWTVRQVVHHVPDSHLNSYIRFRFALTEDSPTIKPYDEARWAELHDARKGPIELSLDLLESLHRRWIVLLRSLDSVALQRTFTHPELGLVPLYRNVCLYGWHSRHHVAHITRLRDRTGW